MQNECIIIKIHSKRMRGESVKIDKKKMELAMANACMGIRELQEATGMPRPTINNAISERGCLPITIGRIARALGVRVEEIIKDDDN